jgi:hypothetical protein
MQATHDDDPGHTMWRFWLDRLRIAVGNGTKRGTLLGTATSGAASTDEPGTWSAATGERRT